MRAQLAGFADFGDFQYGPGPDVWLAIYMVCVATLVTYFLFLH